jgi:tetratricopeptide (TPR) repeat protein
VTGAFEEALAQFDKALDLDADEALARYNAGLVHLLLGERERAREHLLEAEKRSQSLFEVKLQLGKLFLEDGRLAEGRSYLEAAADLQPHSSRVHCLLGECYAALDLQDQALAAYKKSLRINANDAASLSGLGWLYHAMGKNADIAKLFCRHSVEIAPRNGLFHHRLGCLFLKENRLTEAQGAFQTAEELGCDSASQLADVRSRLVEKAS